MESKNNAEQTTLKVVIRVRPLNRKELDGNHENVWNIDSENNYISSAIQNGKRYSFDRIYSLSHTTKDIYNESMSPVIKAFIKGFNGTIFAYGQTSSGKTYTMMGSGANKDDGIIHKAIKYIFRSISEAANREFTLNVSYLEIYNESIKDLLNPSNVDLKISMDGFHRPIVRGITSESIGAQDQIFRILTSGMGNRNIGSTKMNETSSRSHTIFQIHLESRERTDTAEPTELDGSVRSSVLSIVDLAGSERAKKTDASGKRLKEGGHINKSLLTLGIVIKKLSDLSRGKCDAGHIPYRDSKLTHILEPALGGNSKTVVICTMTPADIHQEESTSTLKFASRAKEVKNCASVVEFTDDKAVIKRQKKQIMELQRRVYEQSMKQQGNSDKSDDNMDSNTHEYQQFMIEKETYEKRIIRLKQLCKNPLVEASDEDDDIDIDIKKKKRSVLGKRRRHSVAIELDGTPARKRLKIQLAENMPRTRHSSYATPLNKIRTQKDEMVFKLRKATHISKGLQQELNAKYQDFNEMQMEIDRLNECNSILSQKVEFFESSITDDKEKDHLMQNQRLTLKINELQDTIVGLNAQMTQYKEGQRIDKQDEMEQKLRDELQDSQSTIGQLQNQISELRLNIEQQQKLTESINTTSSREMSVDQAVPNHVFLQMNVSKLQSQLILIKNDKASLQQILNNQQKQFISLKNECFEQFSVRGNVWKHKFNKLQQELDESNDEKRLFESQYHQIREECDEMRSELETLRRPENEIIEELQSELLNTQKQNDMDANYTVNMKHELEDKVIEIENLKQINEELKEDMMLRERDIKEECDRKMNEVRMEMEQIAQLNQRLENGIKSASASQMGLSKIEAMNVSQLKETLKNMKRTLREQQTKMGAVERKKDVHEKTAQKYNKRCGDLEQRFKKVSREHNSIKSQLMSTTKLNKRLKTKNDKLQRDICKIQSETVNAKDLNRKLNITSKRLESVQKKYDTKHHDLEHLKQERLENMKEINGLKDRANTMHECNKKFEKIQKDLKHDLKGIEKERDDVIKEWKTETDVVTMLKAELKRFHQLNGEQNEDLKKGKESMNEYEAQVKRLNADCAALNERIKALENDIKDRDDRLEESKRELNDVLGENKEKEDRWEQQNESLKVSLGAMKETDNIQRNEIDETNKMLREFQIELNGNKKELRDYQNRWQHERKANDLNVEKLRGFELKTTQLLHENQMNRATIDSKWKEIERLNAAAKEQQTILLKRISECADYKTRCELYDNDIDKLKQENELLAKEKERLGESMENKQEVFQQMKCEYNQNKTKMEQCRMQLKDAMDTLERLNGEIADYKQKIQQMTKKCSECNHKYTCLKQKHNVMINDLDERDSEILDLNEKIESMYIGFEKEKKEIEYKLSKKMSELTETTNALCDLQEEFDAKNKEMDGNMCIYKEIETERNSLQIRYAELIKKYQDTEIELKSTNDRLRAIENNLKETMNKLQHSTLQNERLQDDLKEITNSNSRSILEKKYAKAKEYIHQLQNNEDKIKGIIDKKKEREEKYEHAICEWKKHTLKLENKMKQQQMELKNLRPSKAKALRFEKLCKEYHLAKINIFKAQCICKQTQTNECRLDKYYQNKENINNTTNTQSQQTAK